MDVDGTLTFEDKSILLQKIIDRYGLDKEEVAYIGDDENDLSSMGHCGLVGCPADAVETVRRESDYVCQASGGKGAVREFIEHILALQ